ncbi:unnamed protein product [Rotaria socialis]|uniref:Uncharacterized protein n=2 Tax=Rotaria socialis TaxID=392032 RepID=A0A818BBR5_9BILA|nr:unnamed protein product [Rotaria socialis]
MDNPILETYSIFWLDASVDNKENTIAQKKLRDIIDQVRTFVNPEEFLKYVHLIEQGDLAILIVKAVCTKLDELLEVIRFDQRHRGRHEETIAMDILDRSATELNGNFLHDGLLIDVLIRMKPNEQDQKELIELSGKENEGNKVELKLTKEFQKEYTLDRAIWWYTRESFVYRLLNKALRVRNIEMVFLMRHVIRDVYEQLRTISVRSV